MDAGPLGPAVHAQSIVVGVHHACALLDDGRVGCWGTNDWGQLGDGTSSSPDRASLTLGAVIVPGLSGVTRLVNGSGGVCLEAGSCVFGDTTCALLSDKTVQCWGLGAHGQLGNEKQGRDYFEASPVPLKLTGVVDVAMGGSTGCAVVEDGTVSCWGANPRGVLGFTSPDCGPFWGFATDTIPPPMKSPCQAAPQAVPGIKDAVRVAVSGGHQCVLHRDASVTCWGGNVWGELGNGTQQSFGTEPVAPGAPIEGLAAKQIAVADYYSCAILADDSVACWGENTSGQLGQGNDDSDARFQKPTAVKGLDNVKSLSLAGATSMALLAEGTAFAWGDINYVFKESPIPGNAAVYSPTKMNWITDAIDLATSGFLNCVLHADHTITCFDTLAPDYQLHLQAP